MKHLYKKELNYYLNNPVGYIVLILFAVFANFLYVKDLFAIGSASLKAFFSLIPWLMLVFMPALAMRSVSEEKRSNTVEILLTLPLSETEIIVAKYLALLTVAGIGLLLTVSLPVSLMVFSNVYPPEVFAGYLGLASVASAFLAVSVFFSTLTRNQVVAFLASALSLFILVVVGSDMTASIMPKVLTDLTSIFTPIYHLQNFVKGVVDVRSVFYFIGLDLIFLFLSVINLEKRS